MEENGDMFLVVPDGTGKHPSAFSKEKKLK
jgi:hypothetical protein